MRAVTALLVVLSWAPITRARPKVILVSWDGAGFQMASRLLSEGALPNLARMVYEGAWSDGMVTSFPTKTAAAHAMLFTGHYGHTSGITGNRLLRLPKSAYDRLDTMNGFFSTGLRVEPLWVRVARSGRTSYAFHATEAYPFDALERLPPGARERLYVIHGYTGVRVEGESFNEQTVTLEDPEGWAVPESRGPEARAFRFRVGDSSFWGLFFDDDLDPVPGVDTLGVLRSRDATEFEARVKAGTRGGFSTPVRARVGQTPLWFCIRLFDVAPDLNQFVLYRSGAAEVALSNDATPGAGVPVMQVFAGNGGTRAYARGGLGTILGEGGDGTAEARLLATEAHLQEQLIEQARMALDETYGLVVLYSPVTDDVAHVLAGLVDPSLATFDEGRAAQAWQALAEAFRLQDRFLGVILEAAERNGAHVLLVSDHGMAATERLVYLNVALRKAGLLSTRPDGSIDLTSTRALAPPLGDASIAINTTDRLGGIVSLEHRLAVLEEVRGVLERLEDPDTGTRIITAIYEPATKGLLQPGGPTTGDLFLDFAPHYYPSTAAGGARIVEKTEPRGNHIFPPTRREMLAICAAWGPRIPPGTNFGRVRAIDIAPTVFDLLAIDTPGDLPGRSLVPARAILGASR